MNLAIVLDMVADGMPGRVLIGDRHSGLTGSQLRSKAAAGAGHVSMVAADRVVYLGPNGPGFVTALFAATLSGVPFLPLNYRLGIDQLDEIMSRQVSPLVVTDSPERFVNVVPSALTTVASATAHVDDVVWRFSQALCAVAKSWESL